MGALGAFNPSFLSQGPQFQPESPIQTYGKYLSLRAMMDQQKVRAIQLQTEQMQLQQAQQKQQEYQALSRYMQTNPDLTTPEGQRGAIAASPTGGAAVLKALGEANKEQYEALSKQYDYKAKLTADYGNRLWSLRAETDPLKRHQIYQDASKWAVQHGVITPDEYARRQQLQDAPMPQDLANEMNDNIGAVGIFKLKADEAAQQKAALEQPLQVREQTAKTELEEGKASDAAVAGWIQQLRSITDKAGNVDKGRFAALYAIAPPSIKQSLSDQAIPGQILDLIRSTVKTEQLPEYDIKTGQAQMMSQLKPGDWDAQVDAVIPPTGNTAALNQRTKAQIQTAVKMGMPLTAVQAVLKDASDQIGRTETAERTAKATAPTKIYVAGAEAGARSAAQVGNDPQEIAAAIIRGEQPPDLTGMYRFGAPVRAELARQGYDLAKAQLDWKATQAHLKTLNGAQQERLRQAITFTTDSLDQIDLLYKEWQKLGPDSGFKILNRGALSAAKQLPGRTGAVATALEAQINDLTSELGTVYKGGNSSTDESLRLAASNLSGEWNEETFQKAVGQIRQNLKIRRNSMVNSQPAGVRPDSPYVTAPSGGGSAGAATPTPTHRFNPQTGRIEALSP